MKFAICFNTLAIAVIAEPAEKFSNSPSKEEPKAFGVDSIVDWDDVEEDPSTEGETKPFFVEIFVNPSLEYQNLCIGEAKSSGFEMELT